MKRLLLATVLVLPALPGLAVAGLDAAANKSSAYEEQQSDIPSTEGLGGGPQGFDNPNTLNGCMTLWDPQTHMTKHEWRRSCANTLKDEPTVN